MSAVQLDSKKMTIAVSKLVKLARWVYWEPLMYEIICLHRYLSPIFYALMNMGKMNLLVDILKLKYSYIVGCFSTHVSSSRSLQQTNDRKHIMSANSTSGDWSKCLFAQFTCQETAVCRLTASEEKMFSIRGFCDLALLKWHITSRKLKDSKSSDKERNHRSAA